MSTNDRPRFLASSTGMLHMYGCQVFRPYRSRATVVTEDAAAEMAVRCLHCRPRPNGTWVEQGERPTAQDRAAADAARHAASRAAEADTWAAMQSDELDEALRVFVAADAAGAPDAQAAWDAMWALAPEGWNPGRRQRELGL